MGFNADDEWGLKIKRCLLLGRKAMTNLDSVLESRDITVLTKVLIVNPMVFPLVTPNIYSLFPGDRISVFFLLSVPVIEVH